MNRTGMAVQNGVDWVKQWVMAHFVHKNRVAYSSRGVPDRFRLVGLDGDGLIDASFGTGIFAKISGGNTFDTMQVVSGNDNAAAAFRAESGDFGDGDWGQWITVGRNTNATNSGAGFLRLTERDGGYQDLWADATGRLRHRQGAPNTANDLSGSKIAVDNADNAFTTTQNVAGEVRAADALRSGPNNAATCVATMRPTVAISNVPDLGTRDLDLSGAPSGLLFIYCSTEPSMAMFMLAGTAAYKYEDPSSVYSGAAGTASKHNVYWNAGTSSWRIENRRGGTRSYHMFCLGST